MRMQINVIYYGTNSEQDPTKKKHWVVNSNQILQPDELNEP